MPSRGSTGFHTFLLPSELTPTLLSSLFPFLPVPNNFTFLMISLCSGLVLFPSRASCHWERPPGLKLCWACRALSLDGCHTGCCSMGQVGWAQSSPQAPSLSLPSAKASALVCVATLAIKCHFPVSRAGNCFIIMLNCHLVWI